MTTGAGNDSAAGVGLRWDWRLLAEWIVVSGLAYVVIVVGGVVLELLASDTTRELAGTHRALAILLVALIGAAFHGFVLGRWQWRILVKRMPGLNRHRWVMATFVPAFAVWLLAIAPGAVDILAEGGDTLHAFKNGFVQAIVLGPLIGLSQATALRDDTTRWMWWFAANLTTYLFGAAAYEFGKWVLTGLSLPKGIAPAFPLLGFLIHGVWMLWVTAPEATAQAPPTRAAPTRRRVPRPGTPE
jgi:hypothetical protein